MSPPPLAVRPSRRATARRPIVDDSDSDEVANVSVKAQEDSEDEFAVEKKARNPPRQPRSARKVAGAPTPEASAPKPRGRPRKIATAIPKLELDDMTVIKADPESPRKRSATPSKRKGAAVAKDLGGIPPLPTPAPSASPEPPEASTLLADVTAIRTNAALVSHETVSSPIKPIRPLDTVLERPMDIVLKARTMALPPVDPAEPQPRIVITHLMLTNFKSYAGLHEVGPFHASFSSVVGPNGSGKSNVIDALLFVFGFRASKMRQGKLSALIHSSAAHPNLEFCEVAVHFQEVMGQQHGEPTIIPESEIILSRKAFKNSSSKYFLNGKESNFTNVTTLLREKGVDLDHKRFLILQGEVESIAQMKPKAANEHEDGLLEYLEDIVGTSKYKTPIEESAAEVEALNDVCMEKNGRVQHVEKERNGLEDKKAKALAYVHDENELTLKKSALWQKWISEFKGNIAVTNEAIQSMQGQLQTELEKYRGSEEEIKKLEKAHAKCNKEFEAKDKEMQALVKEATTFDQERVKLDEKKKFLMDKQKKLDKTIATSEQAALDSRQIIEQCGEEMETGAKTTETLEDSVNVEEAELAKIRDSLKGKTREFSDQITAKQKALEPWMEKINGKQSAIAVAESELKILQEKANAGTVALTEMQAKQRSIEECKVAKLHELGECEAQKLKLEKETAEVEAELRKLSEKEPGARSKLSAARQKADEARSSLSKAQNQGNVLTALMRMKESGRIDGFRGRLGNLGTIDDKYDVAISTACPTLDSFVTDTVDAGQQCVEYLRKTNLGRGNFICLDKLAVRDMGPVTTPENAPRLFDLIRAKDDGFRPAFYHAVQDTLVAHDLAQANRIAYGAKRWRVVTLAGELIDKSGTMSGGGSAPRRGIMSSKLMAEVSKEQVAKVEEDRDRLEETFKAFQDRQRDRDARLRLLKAEGPLLHTAMQKIRLEVESAAKNLADTQKRIVELENSEQPSRSQSEGKRVSTLEQEIAKLNVDLQRLHSECSSLEGEIKTLQDKIMEIGGERLRAQRAKVDGLKADIAKCNEEMSEAEVRQAKARKQMVKSDKDRANAGRDSETAQCDLQKLEDEIQSQVQKAGTLSERTGQAESGLVETKKQLKTLKAELDQKTAEVNTSRAVEIEMRNRLEENQKVFNETQKQLRIREQLLSELSLHNVDDLVGSKQAPVAANDGNETSSLTEASSSTTVQQTATATGNEEEDDHDLDLDDDGDTTMTAKTGQGRVAQERVTQGQELPMYTPDELAEMNKDKLKGEIAILEERTQNVSVDLSVLAEYRRRLEEHAARSSDLATAVRQRDAAKKRCDDLRRLRLEGFMDGFSAISLRLKEMYQMITMGGNAELELVDSLDPFSEGILFSVMPPKKSWKNISNLSGGEKTLSSLALVFALHHYKPTPLYVMDEIDAALDFRNVSIVANYIKERTRNAQFIVISLRNNMFELAARLVGVYKVNHMTKSVTIENRDFILRRPGPAHGHGHGHGHGQQAVQQQTIQQRLHHLDGVVGQAKEQQTILQQTMLQQISLPLR